ncbi:MAG: hypothetical protein U5K84_11210 [Alkalibacterium sp.]|nr:hypothetical protein [Alkalibacterium sp.]
MPIIYLIETKNNTVLSHGIRLLSKYPYNHLSISLDASLSTVYSFGRRQPHNPLAAGFTERISAIPFTVIQQDASTPSLSRMKNGRRSVCS